MRFIPLCLVLLAFSVGCADQFDDDDPNGQVDDQGDGKADSASGVVGGFDGTAPFIHLGLMSDGTHRTFERATTTAVAGLQSGTFKLTRTTSTGKTYIAFYTASGTLLDRNEYKITTSGLSLRKVYTSTWHTLSRDSKGYCLESNECALESLSHQGTGGTWYCDRAGITGSCYYLPPAVSCNVSNGVRDNPACAAGDRCIQGACEPAHGPTEPCTVGDGDDECADGLFCEPTQTPEPGYTGVCVA